MSGGAIFAIVLSMLLLAAVIVLMIIHLLNLRGITKI